MLRHPQEPGSLPAQMEEDSDLSFLTALILVMTLLPEIATAPGREHGYVSAAVEAPPEMVCSYPSSLG